MRVDSDENNQLNKKTHSFPFTKKKNPRTNLTNPAIGNNIKSSARTNVHLNSQHDKVLWLRQKQMHESFW